MLQRRTRESQGRDKPHGSYPRPTSAIWKHELENGALLAQPAEDVAAHLEAWLKRHERRKRLSSSRSSSTATSPRSSRSLTSRTPPG